VRRVRLAQLFAAFLAGCLVTATVLALTGGTTHNGRPPAVSINQSASASGTPQFLPSATGTPHIWPTMDSRLNFAGGEFETIADMNNCRMHVRLAATSKADGTGAVGTITLTPVQSSRCNGQATGRITCLLVTGNHAVLSGWLDDASGIFDVDNVVLATVTESDPQLYGSPVDRAHVGLASGSPECPPGISGSGPAVVSGAVQVWQAH